MDNTTTSQDAVMAEIMGSESQRNVVKSNLEGIHGRRGQEYAESVFPAGSEQRKALYEADREVEEEAEILWQPAAYIVKVMHGHKHAGLFLYENEAGAVCLTKDKDKAKKFGKRLAAIDWYTPFDSSDLLVSVTVEEG